LKRQEQDVVNLGENIPFGATEAKTVWQFPLICVPEFVPFFAREFKETIIVSLQFLMLFDYLRVGTVLASASW
jgi:hypothetical protein